MTSRNYSSGFKAVLQLLGLSESDVKGKVVIPLSLQGSLRPDDPQSLAPSYQSNVSSAAELLILSGIPPVEAPISLPAIINVFAIGELVIGNGENLEISSQNSPPIVVAADTLVLEPGGQLICDANVILNVQTYT